jgi:hypothetical protein
MVRLAAPNMPESERGWPHAVAFAGQAELADIVRPVDSWLYTSE